MKHFPDGVAASTFSTVSASDAEATETVAAVADQIHVVDFVTVGFDQAPGGVALFKITIGGTIVFQFDYPATSLGTFHFVFPRGLYGNVNEAVVFSLAAGGTAGDIGKVSHGRR